ncbi:DUF805 domain-containing protein [Vibrio aestuarianus]|uniref:DUF805 domain-containing protein n=1 Tax=Vibrio aestuarianus TaxID=28171 RepID=UPI00237CCD19|nr:DUF805 domain-containing protein [Vibrio aestuarianus]
MAVKLSLRFSGRLNRREFWRFLLIHIAVIDFCVIFMLIGFLNETIILSYLLMSGPAFFSSISRRLHDSGYSFGLILIILIPIIGLLIVLAALLKKGQPYHNRFGANPYEWKNV